MRPRRGKISIFAIALVPSLLLGCAAPRKTATQESVTLRLWSIWSSDTESNKAPFLKTLAEFKEKYPSIKVELDQTEASAYNTKIRTAVAANEAPDVFYYNSGGLLKSFVDAGKVLPLDEYLSDEVRSRLVDGALANMTFDGKIYGLPYTLAFSVLYCNTELFGRYGVKVPTTWEELMVAVRAFRKAGVTPMTVGGKDRWPTNLYTDVIALRCAGYEEYRRALYKEAGGSFVTPSLRLGARKFAELVRAGAFQNDAVAVTRDASEVPFYAGKIPMYVSGNWTAGNCQAPDSAVRGKIVAVRFPSIAGGKGDSSDFMGGAAEEFCVAANTKNKAAAVLLCSFIAENHSRNAYLAGAGIPTWKMSVDESKLDPLLKSIVNLTEGSTRFLLWGNNALEGDDSELLLDTTQEFLAGTLSADAYCDKLQTIFR